MSSGCTSIEQPSKGVTTINDKLILGSFSNIDGRFNTLQDSEQQTEDKIILRWASSGRAFVSFPTHKALGKIKHFAIFYEKFF